MEKIYWTAGNNSSFLNGHRTAPTLRGAVRDARRYVMGELYGEGTISYKKSPDDAPFRIDRKNIFSGYKWETITDF